MIVTSRAGTINPAMALYTDPFLNASHLLLCG